MGTAIVKTTMDLAGIQQGMSQAAGIVGGTSSALIGAGKALTLGVTAPLLAMGGVAVKVAVDFDKAMMGVNSVLKLQGAEFEGLKAEVLDFSTQTSKSSADVALALRGITSSGFEAGDAMGILKVSVDAAGNMMVDTATTTRALTSVLKAFGMEAGEVTHVADVMETMANKSAIEFEALTGSIGNATGIAAAAGIPFETLGAALMTVTDAGYSVAESSTAVRAIIQTMLKPTDELADLFEEWGYASGEAALQALGLDGVMEKLRESTGGSAAQVVELLGNVRASKAAFALMSQEGRAFADSLDEVARASENEGEHMKMSDIRHESAAYHMAKLKSEVEVLGIRLGNVLLPTVIDVVDVMKDFATTLATLPPETLELAVKFALLAAAVGPVLIVVGKALALFTTLTSVVSAVGGVFTTTLPSIGAYVTAASGATATTLGFTAAAGPLVIVLGAVAAAAVAVGMAVKLHNDIERESGEVQGTWTKMLQEQVETSRSATHMMSEYQSAQRAVNQAYEDGGIIAQLFIDKQEIAGATTGELTQAVLETSVTYADYTRAMGLVNEEIAEHNEEAKRQANISGIAAAATEEFVGVLSEEAWAIRSGKVELRDSHAAALLYAGGMEEAAKAAGLLAEAGVDLEGTLRGTWEGAELMIGALENVGVAEQDVADITHVLAVEYEKTTDLARMQGDALTLLASAYEAGTITEEMFREAGEDVLRVMDDSVYGYEAVQLAVAGATGSFYGIGIAADELPAKMHEVAQAQLDNAAAAEEMARRQQAAWQTFATSVEGAVGQALQAYQTGNAEMLAEQQQALAEMLWNQTDTMLMMGQVTADQAMAMKSVIGEQYGVMVDETQTATDALLGLFGDWAAGGQTSADDIMAFIQNIGAETDAMVTAQTASIEAGIASWEAMGSNIDEQVGLAGSKFATMEEDVAGMSSEFDTSLGEAGTALSGLQEDAGAVSSEFAGSIGEMESEAAALRGTMQEEMAEAGAAAGDFASDFGAAAGDVIYDVGAIENALRALPDSITVDIYVEYHGPEEFMPESPRSAFHNALERLVTYARGHPVPVTMSMKGGDISMLGTMPRLSRGAGRGSEYHYGGDTVYINDQLSMALYLESRRQQRIERAEMRM